MTKRRSPQPATAPARTAGSTATAPPAPSTTSVVAQLMAVIEERKRNPPAKSYTTTLLNGGIPKIGGKVQEEAREVVEAAYEAGEPGRKHVIAEYRHSVQQVTCVCGWVGSSESPDGRTSDWSRHVTAGRNGQG